MLNGPKFPHPGNSQKSRRRPTRWRRPQNGPSDENLKILLRTVEGRVPGLFRRWRRPRLHERSVPAPTGTKPGHQQPWVCSEAAVQAPQPPVHCGWGAPAEHSEEHSAQLLAGRRAAAANRPLRSRQAGHELTCPPRPRPSRHGIPAPNLKPTPMAT